MQVEKNPTVFVLGVKNQKLEIFILVFEGKLCFMVNGFVHSKVFKVCFGGSVLWSGSLLVDLGGLRIPVMSFCQTERSSSVFV